MPGVRVLEKQLDALLCSERGSQENLGSGPINRGNRALVTKLEGLHNLHLERLTFRPFGLNSAESFCSRARRVTHSPTKTPTSRKKNSHSKPGVHVSGSQPFCVPCVGKRISEWQNNGEG